MIGWHCDRDECDSWVRAYGEFARRWLVLGADDKVMAHFCSLDCLMHWAAKYSEPVETIPND